MELIITILHILKRWVFKRLSAQTCLVEMKIPRASCGKTAPTVNLVKIILENKSHPIKIQKIVVFHYQDRFRRLVRKSNKGPINITRRDSFPLPLESWQDYTLYLTSTDFYGDVPTKGFLLFKIYPHSDKPIKKMLNLSRKKIQHYVKPCSDEGQAKEVNVRPNKNKSRKRDNPFGFAQLVECDGRKRDQ